MLADLYDPATGDFASINHEGYHPVDAAVATQFIIEQGAGPAVASDGHRFKTFKKIGPTTAAQLEDEARRILHPLVDRGDISIDEVKTEAGVDAPDLGAVFLEYTNLQTQKKGSVKLK